MKLKVAIVGSGIAGLAAAYTLQKQAGEAVAITLFEAGQYFGGHANTKQVMLSGEAVNIDTGFLVYNERTYPGLIGMFDDLGVVRAKSDMSFSVQVITGVGNAALEWSGSNLNTVFAQRSNVLKPVFWRMLRDILRFNRLTQALADDRLIEPNNQSVADFVAQHGFQQEFIQHYLLPMIACIWSSPTMQMLHFPMATLIRFCHNHGLLQVTNRPQWYTVVDGSAHYVKKITERIADKRLNCQVQRIVRSESGVLIKSENRQEQFDGVIIATHPDQALAMLGADASDAERRVLGAIRYQANTAVVHTDAALMPKRRLAWAAWNYETSAQTEQAAQKVCLHYWLNALQPLKTKQNVFVTLNPIRLPEPNLVQHRIDYMHPVFDQAAMDAQTNLSSIQAVPDKHACTWYAGAWCRYGFHEDGYQTGAAAARDLCAKWVSAL